MQFLTILTGFVAALPLSSAATIPATNEEALLESALSSRAALTCGSPGYQRSTQPYFAVTNSASALSTACGARCSKDQKCSSYAVGRESCFLYSCTVSQNFQANAGSHYKFYEKSCAQQTPTYSAPSCQLVGYDAEIYSSRFFTKHSCSLSTCSTLCKSKSRCNTLQYTQNTCVLYTQAISKKFTRDSKSPYTFHDKTCSIPSPSTTTSVRTSTVQSSTQATYTTKYAGTSSTTTTSSSSSLAISASSTDSATTSSTISSSSTTLATTTTSSSSAPEGTTYSNILITLGSPQSKKHKRQSSGTSYFSKNFDNFGQRVTTTNQADALTVSVTLPDGATFRPNRLVVLADQQNRYQDLPALTLIRRNGFSAQTFLGAGLKNAGSDNSISRVDITNQYTAQSAVWTVDRTSFNMYAQWINTDGSAVDLTLLTSNGNLFLAEAPSAFPNAVKVTPYLELPSGAQVSVSGPTTTAKSSTSSTTCLYCPSTTLSTSSSSTTCLYCLVTSTSTSSSSTAPSSTSSTATSDSTTTSSSTSSTSATTSSSASSSSTTVVGPSSATLAYGPSAAPNSLGGRFTNLPVTASVFQTPGTSTKRQSIGGLISRSLTSQGARFLTDNAANALKVFYMINSGSTSGNGIWMIAQNEQFIQQDDQMFVYTALVGNGNNPNSDGDRLYLGYDSDSQSPGSGPYNGIYNSFKERDMSGNYVAERYVWNIDAATGLISPFWVDGDGVTNAVTAMTDDGTNLYFLRSDLALNSSATRLQLRIKVEDHPPIITG